uniref:ABC transporter domain-containing protein n=1 Tax=Biomphalaria glabrata TaxID=6526 RepID=A0A2C9L099_BIOGL
MIDVIGLSKRFSDKKLFENVNLRFTQGNTYGIIGANGAGKSTFLKIVAGMGGFYEPSEGQVIIPKDKRISVLGQDQNAFDEYIVTDVVVMGNKELHKVNSEKNAIYENPDSTEKDYEHAAHLEELFGTMGG